MKERLLRCKKSYRKAYLDVDHSHIEVSNETSQLKNIKVKTYVYKWENRDALSHAHRVIIQLH